ncbi:hypothetical protein VTL71DRAFT_4492 [Oculimacula yallundae]|uniref:Uncharacterized protein n=1 Tax=Oculimacula yallundae TaxID=86028 RepID=A0ABR4C4J0_9HELO
MAPTFTGMFGRFDLENPGFLRVLVDILKQLLRGHRQLGTGHLTVLNIAQYNDLLAVLSERDRSPALRDLIDTFVTPGLTDDFLLVVAGLLGDHVPAFAAASPAPKDKTKSSRGTKRTYVQVKANAAAASAERKKRSSARATVEDTSSDSEDSDGAEIMDSEVEEDDDEEEASLQSPAKKRTRSRAGKSTEAKAVPRLQKRDQGSFAVPGQTFDRESAKAGQRDPSKYTIIIEYQKKDKKGKIVPATTIKYEYLKLNPEPIWDSSETLKHFNQWRLQVFKRGLGKLSDRKERHPWLKSEQDLILDLVRQQLERKSKVKWRRLANSYNNSLRGKVQAKGEKLLSKASKSQATKEARVAPWRTSGSIKAMAAKWTEYKELQAQADKKQQAANQTEEVDDSDSEDDDLDEDTSQETKAAAEESSDEERGKSKADLSEEDDSTSEDQGRPISKPTMVPSKRNADGTKAKKVPSPTADVVVESAKVDDSTSEDEGRPAQRPRNF